MATSLFPLGLVGLGNIGFRHLQGLSSIAGRIALNGFDPAAECVERASSEWRGSGAFSTSTERLGASEAFILATPSRGRLQLMEQILDLARPRFMVLEKVVFTRRHDFAVAEQRLADGATRVVVNCPRRLWPLHHRLRDLLRPLAEPVRIVYTDPGLGLACNGVHIVDLLQFLSGQPDVSLVDAEIDGVAPAKRAGYIEAFGRLSFATARGDRLDIVVRAGDSGSQHVQVSAGVRSFTVREGEGTIGTSDGQIVAEVGRPPWQSEMTGSIVADLLDRDSCELPSLGESAAAHGALIDGIEPALVRFGIDCRDGLPIT